MTIDPISDMLVTIRNGLKARLVQVSTPASNIKSEIAKVMKASGYIQDAFTTSEFPKKLVITLKYSDRAEPAIAGLRVSRSPACASSWAAPRSRPSSTAWGSRCSPRRRA